MAQDPTNIDLLPNSRKYMAMALAQRLGQPNPSLGGSLLNGLSMGLMGLIEGNAQDKQLQQQLDIAKVTNGALGGGTPAAPVAPVAPDTSPAPVSPSAPQGKGLLTSASPSTPVTEVDPSALNPLDAAVAKPDELAAALAGKMSPRDLKIAAKTVIGEAGNLNPIDKQNVAAVLLNRSNMAGTSPATEALKPNQFEPWNTAAGQARMNQPTDSPAYQDAARAVYAASQQDPTGGATMFYSPTAQAALGRQPPAWDDGTGRDLGQHRFFNQPYGGQPAMALASPDAPPSGLPPAITQGQQPSPPSLATALDPSQAAPQPGPVPAQPAPPYQVAASGQPPGPPQQAPQAPPMQAEPQQAPPQGQQYPLPANPLIGKFEAAANSATDPRMQALYLQQANALRQQDQAARRDYALKAAEKAFPSYSDTHDKTPNSVLEYQYYQDQAKANGQAPMDYATWSTAKARAGATSINNNVDMGGQQSYDKLMSEGLGKAHLALASGVEDAQTRARDIAAMQGAVDAIQKNGGTTGGLGQQQVLDLQKTINSGASALGFEKPFSEADLSDKEFLTKFNRSMAGAQAKGAVGTRVTNFELNNFLKANPGLDMSVTGNQRLLGIQAQIEQRNIAVGNAIRDATAQAMTAGGKINPVQVQKLITDYDQAHHIQDPITGQDLTQSVALPEFQSQGTNPALAARHDQNIGKIRRFNPATGAIE